MANDFKRMWTAEELKDTYYLGDINNNDYITKEKYDKIISHNFINYKNIIYTKTTTEDDYHVYTCCDSYNAVIGTIEVAYFGDGCKIFIYEHGYANSDTVEELVRETPTDVSIIEDQGKLELMLEHDGNVLAINDTPNQFLQRRLDKPSKTILDSKVADIVDEIKNMQYSCYEGQIIYCKISDNVSGDEGYIYGIVYMNDLPEQIRFMVMGSVFYSGTNNSFVTGKINTADNEITLFKYDDTPVVYSIYSIREIKFF